MRRWRPSSAKAVATFGCAARKTRALLEEARGKMNRYKNYTEKDYNKGFEMHNHKNQRELDVGNDLRHLKWTDWRSSNPGQGHIFYGD